MQKSKEFMKKIISLILDFFILSFFQSILISLKIILLDSNVPVIPLSTGNVHLFFVFPFIKLLNIFAPILGDDNYDGYPEYGAQILFVFIYLTDYLYFLIPRMLEKRTLGKYCMRINAATHKKNIFLKALSVYIVPLFEVIFMYVLIYTICFVGFFIYMFVRFEILKDYAT